MTLLVDGSVRRKLDLLPHAWLLIMLVFWLARFVIAKFLLTFGLYNC